MPEWLVVDPRNPRSAEAAEALLAAMEGEPESPPTVVLGGDGFLLRTVASAGFEGTFLGLNTGHLGFLHNDVDDWVDAAAKLVRGDWFTHDFPLLHARIDLRDDGELDELAMNDVYLERATGQAARLAITVDDTLVVENLVADGVIVATALGSTAYSFSAGGGPSHPLNRLLKVTPICPHLPRLSPFDLRESATVRVEVVLEDRRPVRAVVDGRETEPVRSVTVGTADRTVQLAYFEGHDFTQHLLTKIVRP